MTRGRRPTRQVGIAGKLRRKIIDGAWTEGQRVPSQLELSRLFGAPPLTVRRAIARLVNEGFLQTRDRLGTFVCQRPPHGYHYALVVPQDPTDASTRWSRFYSTLINAAPAVARRLHLRLSPFYGLDSPHAADYARLAEWCRDGSLAGIIFASAPFGLKGSPILEKAGIPRVAIMSRPAIRHLPTMSLHLGFFTKAYKWLASRGRRRLALLVQSDELFKQDFATQAAACGLDLPPAWQLPMSPQLPEAAGAYVRLLLSGPQSNWPDALLIGDDNYTQSALIALRASGARLGIDLDVVTHCNFPAANLLGADVQKLGYSASEVLERAIQLLDQQRSGAAVPAVTTIEARFEDEVGEQPTRAGLVADSVTTGESK